MTKKIAIEGLQWRYRWQPTDTEEELASREPALAALLASRGAVLHDIVS